MAMPQRDNVIEGIKRLDLLLEYAVQHGDEAEATRLREGDVLVGTAPQQMRISNTESAPIAHRC